jgi:hypothetical protein
MSDLGLATEYENGVADVLAFLAGPNATVERNVHLLGLRSKRKRQVDVLNTTVAGLGATQVVVGCKRHSHRLTRRGFCAGSDLREDAEHAGAEEVQRRAA